ncbi:MAG: hypothetical protein OCD76_03050 [Reichenbachiella sp.]
MINKIGNTVVHFLVLILFVQCNKQVEQQVASTIVIGIDLTVSENKAYATVGKTKLSDYDFFVGQLSDLKPNKRVLPFDLNTPLFTDYASKKRFIYLPKDSIIGYRENKVLDFPIGAVLIKNFYYAKGQLIDGTKKIIETRLLIHEASGWKALPYIWNADQTEAFLEVTGGKLTLELQHVGTFDYVIPDMTQCKSCHDYAGETSPIGPSVRQLNRSFPYALGTMNQMTKLAKMDWIDILPDSLPRLAIWNDPSTGNLNNRARAYLDINCAHCHNDNGPAKNSGLDLTFNQADAYKYGVHKKPVAAGKGSADLKYGISPGKPNESILLHRMSSTEPGSMMPELGRSLTHTEGIALIKEWIENM